MFKLKGRVSKNNGWHRITRAKWYKRQRQQRKWKKWADNELASNGAVPMRQWQ